MALVWVNAQERERTGEHALATFLDRLKARGAPPPDPVVIDVFNESVDDLLRSTAPHKAVMRGPAPQYVGLAEPRIACARRAAWAWGSSSRARSPARTAARSNGRQACTRGRRFG